MTLATILTLSDFGVLAESAFQAETPLVASSESDLGEPLERFVTAEDIRVKAAQCIKAGIRNYSFALWYPSMKGQALERQIALDPPREGKSFRHSLTGWGVIHLRIYYTPPGTFQCRIVVNSEARAKAREDRYPELGATAVWDWRVVDTYAFRLSRTLASMGRTAPVIQPSAG